MVTTLRLVFKDSRDRYDLVQGSSRYPEWYIFTQWTKRNTEHRAAARLRVPLITLSLFHMRTRRLFQIVYGVVYRGIMRFPFCILLGVIVFDEPNFISIVDSEKRCHPCDCWSYWGPRSYVHIMKCIDKYLKVWSGLITKNVRIREKWSDHGSLPVICRWAVTHHLLRLLKRIAESAHHNCEVRRTAFFVLFPEPG